MSLFGFSLVETARLNRIEHHLTNITAALVIIMATQKEAAAQLKAANDSLSKIGGETGTLLTEIEKLKEIIAGGEQPVIPELQAQLDIVSAKAQQIDDMVPDAPTPEPPPEP